MIKRSRKDIAALLDDPAVMERASRLAFYDAVRRHRQGNVPMVFWEDGRVVHRSPFDIPIPHDVEEDDADGPGASHPPAG